MHRYGTNLRQQVVPGVQFLLIPLVVARRFKQSTIIVRLPHVAGGVVVPSSQSSLENHSSMLGGFGNSDESKPFAVCCSVLLHLQSIRSKCVKYGKRFVTLLVLALDFVLGGLNVMLLSLS